MKTKFTSKLTPKKRLSPKKPQDADKGYIVIINYDNETNAFIFNDKKSQMVFANELDRKLSSYGHTAGTDYNITISVDKVKVNLSPILH